MVDGDGEFIAIETTPGGETNIINIRMCSQREECPYQEPMETKKASVLNGRYAIALGKPVEKTEELEEKKYESVGQASPDECRAAIVKALLKDRPFSSLSTAITSLSEWSEDSSQAHANLVREGTRGNRRCFRNVSWSTTDYAVVKLSEDKTLDVDIKDDLPF
jgi:hypothetical protein